MKKLTPRKQTINENIARWKGHQAGFFQGVLITLVLVMLWRVIDIFFK